MPVPPLLGSRHVSGGPREAAATADDVRPAPPDLTVTARRNASPGSRRLRRPYRELTHRAGHGRQHGLGTNIHLCWDQGYRLFPELDISAAPVWLRGTPNIGLWANAFCGIGRFQDLLLRFRFFPEGLVLEKPPKVAKEHVLGDFMTLRRASSRVP